MYPEVIVTGSRKPGEMTLQFADPAGEHLPQLRHIINSYIAGDVMSLRGLLAYTGPTKPKAPKGAETLGRSSACAALRWRDLAWPDVRRDRADVQPPDRNL